MLAVLNQAYIYKDLMHYVLLWSSHICVEFSALELRKIKISSPSP